MPRREWAAVVPVGPAETAWPGLLADLAVAQVSVVVAATAPPSAALLASWQAYESAHDARWLQAERGRARQLNAGAKAADAHWLWFLHADSRLGPGAFAALQAAIARHGENALYYLDLAFTPGSGRLMALTAWGARQRSRRLGLPFGDQGFCLAAHTFERLGGFDEAAPYGEDHLLVWQARRAGLALVPINASIETSARKYQARGWLTTTLQHAWLTWRQAYPQWRIRP